MEGEFHDGRAFVSKGLNCVIDEKGYDIFNGDSDYFISSFVYNSQFDVIPGYVYIDDEMKQKKYGLVGIKGNVRIPPSFDDILSMRGNYLIVANQINNEFKYGMIELF